MGSLLVPNTCYGVDIPGSVDIISGPFASYAGVMQVGGGKKKRKQMRTKKRGSSKRKNRRVSTIRKKKGRSFKRRKHSKREVIKSIMKGLGEKRKSRKKSYN
tara:strand:+ start:120 stop:425 length:306 start_codon:yes stop_codon:yes gene_type:complete